MKPLQMPPKRALPVNPAHEANRQRIADDMAAFAAKGGEVEVLPSFGHRIEGWSEFASADSSRHRTKQAQRRIKKALEAEAADDGT